LWDRAPKEKSSSRTSEEVNTGTREQPGGSGGASEPKNKHLVFPFIGKVPVHVKNEVVRWTDEDGRVVEIPFKFLYAENGVWVRAEYEAKSNEFKELPLEMLEGLYRQGGETIIGLPAEAPRLSLSEFFTLFHPRLPFEKGSKIILEHVLLHVEPAESAEPYLIMKVWGAERAWENSPDPIPRVRICLGLESGRSFLDDAL
jgi:hypothetical protein